MKFFSAIRPRFVFATAPLLLAMFGTVTAHAALYVSSDRTIAGGNPIRSSDFGVYVGRDINNTRYTGVHADLVGATDSWNLETLSDSIVTASNTYIEQMYVQENSTATVTGGIINNGINVSDLGMFTLTGGTLTTSVAVSSAAPVLPGGKRATANILGGSFNNFARASNYGVLNISGGTFANAVIGGDNASVAFGGTASTLHMYATENAHITVTGGSIGDLRVSNNAVVDVYGGIISPNTVYGLSPTSMVNFYGNNLQYSNPTAGTFAGNNGFYWDLSGTLQNGDTLSTRLFDQGGTASAPTTLHFNPVATVVPEAGSAILALGSVIPFVLFARRRRP